MDHLFGGVFSGRKVLVTGHTGFKGSWLSFWLTELGAKVTGYALTSATTPNLFTQLGLSRLMDSRIGDIRDLENLKKVVREARPEIVFHLAAQPLVRYSYEEPIETFSVNVLGTANLLEATRESDSVRVCQVITTDKCYENRETDYAYREEDRLGGRDPYSASKACAEMVVASYRDSFFSAETSEISLSSARAGNVIGGGDWAKDRLIPDCIRALTEGRAAEIRNPRSVRPWQHVLEPLSGYLRLAEMQWRNPGSFSEAWNFGPEAGEVKSVRDVVEIAARLWPGGAWTALKADSAAPHEARLLQLDNGKAKKRLGWRPVYQTQEAVEKTIIWYLASRDPGFNFIDFTRGQIKDYVSLACKMGLSWAVESENLKSVKSVS